MTSAWPFIDADNEVVADLIAGTVEIVLEQGGWLNPEACIVARNGDLSITSAADDGALLMHLPREAFVRISRVQWTDSDTQLEMLDVSDDLGVAESELLILQTALHNACGKVPALVATHPVMARDLPDDVVIAVRALRPSFRRRQPAPAQLFWSDRAFRFPLTDDGTTEAVAVPLVDLLNHRHGGATGTWTGGAFDVTTQRAAGSAECMLDYGFDRDAIGMAVVYGFADLTSSVAHSAPIAVDVPGVGRGSVAAIGRTATGQLLPPRVDAGPDGFVVSHVTFGQLDRQSLVEQLKGSAGWTGKQASDVLDTVAQRNIDLLDELTSCALRYPGVPSAVILGDAANQQRQVIENSWER